MKHRLQKHKNETQTQTAETPIALWVDCYRFNNSPLLRCVHSTQDFKRMVKQ